MRSRPVLVLALALVSMLASPGGRAAASSGSRAKPKPVRAALEARYAGIANAYLREGPEAILASRDPGFHVLLPSGETWDARTSEAYTRAGFAQVETTLVVTFDIGTIDVRGDTAAAEIDQHWVRRQRKAGAVRLVDTRAHQRETWVRREGAWFLWRVDQVVPGPWIIDGKRVDPSRPYDPDAPPYVPPDSSAHPDHANDRALPGR